MLLRQEENYWSVGILLRLKKAAPREAPQRLSDELSVNFGVRCDHESPNFLQMRPAHFPKIDLFFLSTRHRVSWHFTSSLHNIPFFSLKVTVNKWSPHSVVSKSVCIQESYTANLRYSMLWQNNPFFSPVDIWTLYKCFVRPCDAIYDFSPLCLIFCHHVNRVLNNY